MHRLDKLGTHLKYFSQKQDSILIRNELTSAQHRWDKILSRSAERTRHLDVGYKDAKRFAESWGHLVQWLEDHEAKFDADANVGTDSAKIKQQIQKHKEFQRALGAKQPALDLVIRRGKMLKDKAPKSDSPILTEMINQLKTKWNALCGRSVDRQRALEEALLYSGQFKDALQALLDWLCKVEPQLADDQLVHGDLDTVNSLNEEHQAFEQELVNRDKQRATVQRAAEELMTQEESTHLQSQLVDLGSRWERVQRLSQGKRERLDQAVRFAGDAARRVWDRP